MKGPQSFSGRLALSLLSYFLITKATARERCHNQHGERGLCMDWRDCNKEGGHIDNDWSGKCEEVSTPLFIYNRS
jgi:hypothetical protein